MSKIKENMECYEVYFSSKNSEREIIDALEAKGYVVPYGRQTKVVSILHVYGLEPLEKHFPDILNLVYLW